MFPGLLEQCQKHAIYCSLYKLAIYCSENLHPKASNLQASLLKYFIFFLLQALFGILFLIYIPELDPYPGYHIVNDEPSENVEYDALRGGEHICPERHASIFSSRYPLN